MGRKKTLRDYALGANGRWYRFFRASRTAAVMDEDWDNLLILDACRFDMFENRNILPGQLDYIYSKGVKHQPVS